MSKNKLLIVAVFLSLLTTGFAVWPKDSAQAQTVEELNNKFDSLEEQIRNLSNNLPPPGSRSYDGFIQRIIGLYKEQYVVAGELYRLTGDPDWQARQREIANNIQALGGNLPEEEEAECGFFDISCHLRRFVAWIGRGFTWVFAALLGLIGLIFDLTVEYSVVNFSSLVSGEGTTVMTAWRVLRDVANLFFIFILLYAAIGMILQLPNVNGRKILVTVIIVALLINFSAFFARVIIDISNVAAYQFYQAILGPNNTSISTSFMNSLPLTAVIATPSIGEVGIIGSLKEELVEWGKVILQILATIIILIIAIFLFLAAAILFVIRTVGLIFLIILAPLAFLMYAFPNQQDLYHKWWRSLLNQSFFAPAYLLMVYVTLQVLQSEAVKNIANQAGRGFVELVFYYLIAIGLLFGALIIAKQLGALGMQAAMRGAGAVTGASVGAVGGVIRYGGRYAKRSSDWLDRKLVGRLYGKSELLAGARWTSEKVLSPTVKAAETVVPGVAGARRAAKEAVTSPLKTTAEGLAAVTKLYGIPGVLGRTRDEEAEAKKREKERKEEERKKEVKQAGEDLKRLRGLPTAQAETASAKFLDKLNSKEIAELIKDNKELAKAAYMIRHYRPVDLKAMEREGVARETMNDIFAQISEAGEQHQAYNYVQNNPTRAMMLKRQREEQAPPTETGMTGMPPRTEPGGPSGKEPPAAGAGPAPAGAVEQKPEQIVPTFLLLSAAERQRMRGLGYNENQINAMTIEDARKFIYRSIK